jgi:hypothetical protein
VSDETGRAHQVCKKHVRQNTETLVDELSDLIRAGQDRSLASIHVSDVGTVPRLIKAYSRSGILHSVFV